ncbi:MAG TPA: serine/threonine-protein kinase [Ktedonobacterales bacterium]|nr:serine/threonine-protein kinase [Ktedonobacterales bacterium]
MAANWGGNGNGYGDDTTHLNGGSVYQLAPGTLLQDRYRVESVLGKGGMGHVYIVRDEHFADAHVTPLRSMKEMIPRFHELQNNMSNFRREALVLESLRHPNIPRVYDSFEQFNRAYLVLEYIEGFDLEQVLDTATGALDPATVGNWMIQICDIVYFLHMQSQPIIFRDLKPSNVILTPDHRIVLIDFGIAKVFQSADPQTNVGTQGYAAPEQYERRAETRSDIYAIGAMMHHLLTKSDPRYQAPFSFHERPPRALNPAVSPELEKVVMKCLEQNKEHRYQNVLELKQALEQALGLGPAMDTGVVRAFRPPDMGSRTWTGGPAPSAIMTQSPRVRWRYQTEEEVRSTPTIANGMLYIGSYDHNLYALDLPTGRLRWNYSSDAGICATAAIWRHLVIVGSQDFNVYGLDGESGKEVWQYRTFREVSASPRVYEDRLYVGSDDGHMHAIDPRSGRALWRYRTYREILSSAAYANGLLFFGGRDEYFYAVDAITGDVKWKYRTQGDIISSPVVADGYVYFGSMDFAVYALEVKSGWMAWREPTDKFVLSSPLVVNDRLYIGSSDRHLYCLDKRTGQRLWKYPAGQQVNSAPAYANGVIYFGCIDGGVYAIDASSGKLIWRFQTGDKVCGSPVVHEGVVYVGSSDNYVYALEANP